MAKNPRQKTHLSLSDFRHLLRPYQFQFSALHFAVNLALGIVSSGRVATFNPIHYALCLTDGRRWFMVGGPNSKVKSRKKEGRAFQVHMNPSKGFSMSWALHLTLYVHQLFPCMHLCTSPMKRWSPNPRIGFGIRNRSVGETNGTQETSFAPWKEGDGKG